MYCLKRGLVRGGWASPLGFYDLNTDFVLFVIDNETCRCHECCVCLCLGGKSPLCGQTQKTILHKIIIDIVF